MTAPSTQLLGCGRDIDQVWDHLDQAPDAHERTCRYCQAARADLANLAQATQTLRAHHATNPDLAPSPGVLDRILAVARAEVRRGRRLPLDQPFADNIAQASANTVSEQAVTTVIRNAGDQNPQIQIRRVNITSEPDPNPSPRRTSTSTQAFTPLPDSERGTIRDAQSLQDLEPRPGTVRVSLRVSVERDLSIADASDRLRSSVIDAVAREVGMDVSTVDITVEDLHDA